MAGTITLQQPLRAVGESWKGGDGIVCNPTAALQQLSVLLFRATL